MSSISFEGWADAPGGMAETAAAVTEAVATATASTDAAQAASAGFIVEHGAQVLAGHPQVTGPAGDAAGDADLSPDASDS